MKYSMVPPYLQVTPAGGKTIRPDKDGFVELEPSDARELLELNILAPVNKAEMKKETAAEKKARLKAEKEAEKEAAEE